MWCAHNNIIIVNQQYLGIRMDMALHKARDCVCSNCSILLDKLKGNL